MPITQASLTSGSSGVDASLFTTASITPTANRLVIVVVLSHRTPAGVAPTLSGNGLTYVQIATQTFSTGNAHRITMFRAMGSAPTAGAITIEFGEETQNACAWSVFEFDGVDTTGTNGSGAVVQSATNSISFDTVLTVTLAAFASANNGACSGFGFSTADTVTPDTGWTEIHEVSEAGVFTNETQWRADNDTTASATGTNSQDIGGIAIEIKAAAASSAGARLLNLMGVGN